MTYSSLRKVTASGRRRLAYLLFCALFGPYIVLAQEQLADTAAGPTEPTPATEVPVQPKPAVSPDQPEKQDKRIMGVLPNYRTADGTKPFQSISAKTKITIASKDSFDWPNYIIGGIFAGIYQLDNDHPNFGHGVAGYARYYGTSYADQVIGNMLTEGIMPIVFHEDPRYFRKVHGRVLTRVGYSLTRVLVTKTDHGNTTVNFAEIVGNGMGASISNLYYTQEQGFRDTSIRWGTQIATDALSNLLKEFWPDIKRHLHKNHDAQLLTTSR
jgi:hypothetical protein